jgi:hypothetical protein
VAQLVAINTVDRVAVIGIAPNADSLDVERPRCHFHDVPQCLQQF